MSSLPPPPDQPATAPPAAAPEGRTAAAPPGTQQYPGRYTVVRRGRFLLFLAQVLVVLQGEVALAAGIFALAFGLLVLANVSTVTGSTDVPGFGTVDATSIHNGATGLAIAGAIIFVIANLVLWAGFAVSRPSLVARVLLIILAVLALVGWIFAVIGSVNHHGNVIPAIVMAAVELFILFALFSGGRTRRVYAGPV